MAMARLQNTEQLLDKKSDVVDGRERSKRASQASDVIWLGKLPRPSETSIRWDAQQRS
jgi:hypothetical protein